ncbi:MAG: universal stress protein [Hyphomicrobiales bacterium]|nr:universal stress protein [Hyphomicrobiales bacterium]MCP4997272.1 universal stress protein [Hyphomicrobiales bacterium]
MAITTLLAFHSTDEPLGNVKPVIELAGEMGAHLNLVVFGVLVPVYPSAYPGVPDFVSADIYKEAAEKAEQQAGTVDALIQESNVSTSIMVECVDRGMIGRTMSGHALCADVTVFANDTVPDHDLATGAFNGVLFDAARPVLILGAQNKPLPELKTALMAWNGEPEAASAIHHSLLLLENTPDVNLVHVQHDDPSSHKRAEQEMQRFLERHEKDVKVDSLQAKPADVADVLLKHAQEINAGIIVMGAYGHSRLREWLLGGTTRDLLSKTKLPVFMAH